MRFIHNELIFYVTGKCGKLLPIVTSQLLDWLVKLPAQIIDTNSWNKARIMTSRLQSAEHVREAPYLVATGNVCGETQQL